MVSFREHLRDADDARVMHEHVGAMLSDNESVAFRFVKPLNNALLRY